MTDPTTWGARGLGYVVDDGVAWLRLQRAHKRNAIDRPLRTALLEAFEEVEVDPAVRVAVITGEGSAFSSGADMTQDGGPIEIPAERLRPGIAGIRDDGMRYGWWRLMEAIWRSETPYIAAVNGPAVGGGCQLALACDLVLAAEGATFWEVFAPKGLPLEGGGAWLLTRSLSLARAKELAMFGDPLPAAEAERWGLVNRCVPADELEATARDWARRLAAVPRAGHVKGQLNGAWEQTMQQTFVAEATLLGMMGP